MEGGDAEGIDVRSAKGAKPKTPKALRGGDGEGAFASLTDYGVWGNVMNSPSGVRG